MEDGNSWYEVRFNGKDSTVIQLCPSTKLCALFILFKAKKHRSASYIVMAVVSLLSNTFIIFSKISFKLFLIRKLKIGIALCWISLLTCSMVNSVFRHYFSITTAFFWHLILDIPGIFNFCKGNSSELFINNFSHKNCRYS